MPTVETRLGDRLDTLASRYLKNPLKWERITAENPGLTLTKGLYLPPGLMLKIPELVPDKIPDLLPWDNQSEIFNDPALPVFPDSPSGGGNLTDIMTGSGWLTPQQIRLLLSLPEQKVLTGTTAAAEDAIVQIAHGLDSTKFTAVRGLVFHLPGAAVPLSAKKAGFSTLVEVDPINIVIKNELANSAAILSKPVTIVIEYRL